MALSGDFEMIQKYASNSVSRALANFKDIYDYYSNTPHDSDDVDLNTLSVVKNKGHVNKIDRQMLGKSKLNSVISKDQTLQLRDSALGPSEYTRSTEQSNILTSKKSYGLDARKTQEFVCNSPEDIKPNLTLLSVLANDVLCSEPSDAETISSESSSNEDEEDDCYFVEPRRSGRRCTPPGGRNKARSEPQSNTVSDDSESGSGPSYSHWRTAESVRARQKVMLEQNTDFARSSSVSRSEATRDVISSDSALVISSVEAKVKPEASNINKPTRAPRRFVPAKQETASPFKAQKPKENNSGQIAPPTHTVVDIGQMQTAVQREIGPSKVQNNNSHLSSAQFSSPGNSWLGPRHAVDQAITRLLQFQFPEPTEIVTQTKETSQPSRPSSAIPTSNRPIDGEHTGISPSNNYMNSTCTLVVDRNCEERNNEWGACSTTNNQTTVYPKEISRSLSVPAIDKFQPITRQQNINSDYRQCNHNNYQTQTIFSHHQRPSRCEQMCCQNQKTQSVAHTPCTFQSHCSHHCCRCTQQNAFLPVKSRVAARMKSPPTRRTHRYSERTQRTEMQTDIPPVSNMNCYATKYACGFERNVNSEYYQPVNTQPFQPTINQSESQCCRVSDVSSMVEACPPRQQPSRVPIRDRKLTTRSERHLPEAPFSKPLSSRKYEHIMRWRKQLHDENTDMSAMEASEKEDEEVESEAWMADGETSESGESDDTDCQILEPPPLDHTVIQLDETTQPQVQYSNDNMALRSHSSYMVSDHDNRGNRCASCCTIPSHSDECNVNRASSFGNIHPLYTQGRNLALSSACNCEKNESHTRKNVPRSSAGIPPALRPELNPNVANENRILNEPAPEFTPFSDERVFYQHFRKMLDQCVAQNKSSDNPGEMNLILSATPVSANSFAGQNTQNSTDGDVRLPSTPKPFEVSSPALHCMIARIKMQSAEKKRSADNSDSFQPPVVSQDQCLRTPDDMSSPNPQTCTQPRPPHRPINTPVSKRHISSPDLLAFQNPISGLKNLQRNTNEDCMLKPISSSTNPQFLQTSSAQRNLPATTSGQAAVSNIESLLPREENAHIVSVTRLPGPGIQAPGAFDENIFKKPHTMKPLNIQSPVSKVHSTPPKQSKKRLFTEAVCSTPTRPSGPAFDISFVSSIGVETNRKDAMSTDTEREVHAAPADRRMATVNKEADCQDFKPDVVTHCRSGPRINFGRAKFSDKENIECKNMNPRSALVKRDKQASVENNERVQANVGMKQPLKSKDMNNVIPIGTQEPAMSGTDNKAPNKAMRRTVSSTKLPESETCRDVDMVPPVVEPVVKAERTRGRRKKSYTHAEYMEMLSKEKEETRCFNIERMFKSSDQLKGQSASEKKKTVCKAVESEEEDEVVNLEDTILDSSRAISDTDVQLTSTIVAKSKSEVMRSEKESRLFSATYSKSNTKPPREQKLRRVKTTRKSPIHRYVFSKDGMSSSVEQSSQKSKRTRTQSSSDPESNSTVRNPSKRRRRSNRAILVTSQESNAINGVSPQQESREHTLNECSVTDTSICGGPGVCNKTICFSCVA